MKENLITFEAETPNELLSVLARFSTADTDDCQYSALAISDPEVLIYPFNIKDTTLADVKKQVFDEVKDIFSLRTKDIEYDLQIFSTQDNRVAGVCIAIPKKLLHQYIKILDDKKLVPIRIIPYASAIIDYYFQKHKNSAASFCIIDFSKKFIINLAVFQNNNCELIRQIPYQLLSEAQSEIIETLKNVCLMTDVKKLDYICFAGTLEDKMGIIQDVEAAFQAKIERDHAIEVVTALSLDDYYFNINFIKNYTFSFFERMYVSKIVNLFMILYFLLVIFLSSQIFFKQKELNDLNSSYTLKDHDYARNLKEQLDSL